MSFSLNVSGHTESTEQEDAIRRECEFFAVSLARKFPTVINTAAWHGEHTISDNNLRQKGLVH
jgi:hypothetical protein